MCFNFTVYIYKNVGRYYYYYSKAEMYKTYPVKNIHAYNLLILLGNQLL